MCTTLMMKISSPENENGRHTHVTKTALFVRFLVKICFFPISVKNGQIFFSWISLKTFIYLFFSLGAIGFKFLLYIYFFPEEIYGYLEGKKVKFLTLILFFFVDNHSTVLKQPFSNIDSNYRCDFPINSVLWDERTGGRLGFW